MPTACPREPLVNKVRCASLGGGPQAMSVCIVEGRQQRPGPPTAACGGNGGRARWPPGLAAAAPKARYRGPGSAGTRRAHGSCWALPSSVWRSLHGPECGLRFRCSSSTMCTDIAFLLLGSSDVRSAAVARPSSRLAYHGVPGQPLGIGYAMRPRLTSTARSGSSLAPERCASIPMRATPRSFQHLLRSEEELARLLDEQLRLVVMDPVPRARDVDQGVVRDGADAAVEFGIDGPALEPAQQQRRARDLAPDLGSVPHVEAVGREGADVVVELPGQGPVGVPVRAVERQMARHVL